jgi:hypothetical protein
MNIDTSVIGTSHNSKLKIAASLTGLVLLMCVSSTSASLIITATTTNNASVFTTQLAGGHQQPDCREASQLRGGWKFCARLWRLRDHCWPSRADGWRCLIRRTAYPGQYATCGYDNGAGAYVIYTLPAAANGYNITNITTYTTWGDNAISQQKYAVSYSTVDNPNSFIFWAL